MDGVIPGTPAEEVVGVIQLTSATVGATESFVFAGTHFDGVMEGPGGLPHDGIWKPALAPDAEYCATMTLYGRNDWAASRVISNQVCAKVRSADAFGSSRGCSFGGPPDAGWTALLILVGLAMLQQRLSLGGDKRAMR